MRPLPVSSSAKRRAQGRVAILSLALAHLDSDLLCLVIKLITFRAVVASDAHVLHQFFPPVAQRMYNLRPGTSFSSPS